MSANFAFCCCLSFFAGKGVGLSELFDVATAWLDWFEVATVWRDWLEAVLEALSEMVKKQLQC